MRPRFKLLVPALALCAAAFAAGAHAQSVDIRVLGSVTPPSCMPSMSNGGVADYGTIPASILNQTEYTKLPDRDIVLSIVCPDRTRVAVRLIDNRHESVIPGIITKVHSNGWADTTNFGLGTSGGAKIGGYAMTLQRETHTMDGDPALLLRSTNAGSKWAVHPLSGVLYKLPDDYYSWATTGSQPMAFQNLTSTIRIRGALNRADELPLSGNVELDGSATVELIYL